MEIKESKYGFFFKTWIRKHGYFEKYGFLKFLIYVYILI
jgi:hypothetical protein